MISAGVFRRSRSQGTAAVLKRVMARESSRASRVPLATLRLTPASSLAPNRWEVRMPKPAVIPRAKPSTRNIRVPVEPTAARAPAPTYRPTMIMSAMLYSCWNTLPTNMGNRKWRMMGTMGPRVMSFCIMIHYLCQWPKERTRLYERRVLSD